MLIHYLTLGVRSLRRNPVLTALMVMAVGLGVAASMTSYAVFRAVSGDPIPQKSAQLFVPQIDNWGPQARHGGDLPDALSYTDATALLRGHAATRQSAIYPVGFHVVPAQPTHEPFAVSGYAVGADFFPMFDVPFRYGSGWSADNDSNHAGVAVISDRLERRLFGGADPVGREIRLDDHDYRVIGVIGDWNPRPRFYDANNGNAFARPPDVFIPFTRAIDLQLATAGDNDCSGTAGQAPGWDGWLQSGCVWVSYWVQLPDAASADHYRTWLRGYAAEQQRVGRFQWTPGVRLDNLTQWLDREHVVPPETSVSLLLSLGFLGVCLVNTVGLLLAKFLRRAGEIGVRRALGASRRAIYVQFLAEATMVGVAGGLLGLLLTLLGVFATSLVFAPDIARLAHVDPVLVGLTLLVSVVATMVASFYPTWRAAHVQPAWQLKTN